MLPGLGDDSAAIRVTDNDRGVHIVEFTAKRRRVSN